MEGGEEESQVFPKSGDWDITKQSFIPQKVQQKVVRAWDRVPVVAQVGRFQGNTVWKKAATKKYGTSKEIEAEVFRELDANGETARKRVKKLGIPSCILDATWATVTDVYPQDSLIPTIVEPTNTITIIEEEKCTFPTLHFVPRKRTYTDQIITPPKEVEQEAVAHLTEEATKLLTTKVVDGEENKLTRRRKSTRMSMANRRITLGAPNLGLDSPLRSTPLKTIALNGTPSKATPMKVFQSDGGGNATPVKLEFGANTLARVTKRRTTIGGANELPLLPKAPLRRSLRKSIGGGRKSLVTVPTTELDSNNSVSKAHTTTKDGEAQLMSDAVLKEEPRISSPVGKLARNPSLTKMGKADSKEMDVMSPKRKRSSSPVPTTRKSSRLSILPRTSISSCEDDQVAKDIELPILSKKNVQTDLSSSVSPEQVIEEEVREDGAISSSVSKSNEDMIKPSPKPSPKRWTEAPDLFGTSPSSQREIEVEVGHDIQSTGNLRSPTRRSNRDVAQEPQNITSKVDILISIKSIHMATIHSGLKTHEFRAYRLPEDTRHLWLYETAPKQSITHVATIGPAKAPGQIDEKGLGNADFNSGREKSHYAYEILQLYELKDKLSLSTLLEKQYAKGPPQKYSFANQKMLNEISLIEDANLIFDKTFQESTISDQEALNLPQPPSTNETVVLFPLDLQKDEKTSGTDEHVEDHDEMLVSSRLEAIEEEVAAKEDTEVSSIHPTPEQKLSLRLRSLSPAFEDLLAAHSVDNQSLLLSPVKDDDNKLSKLSPIQLGNILLRELDGEDGSVSPTSPSNSVPNDSASEITKDNINSASTLSPHDDTSMLEDFVTRVRASRAANVQDQSKSISKSSILRSPMRNPLAKVDSNHSPQNTSSSHIGRLTGSPVETPSSLKSTRTKRAGSPLKPFKDDELPTTRRSARAKTPVKGASSLPVPVSAPSAIPLRRLGGPGEVLSDANFALKQKADKKLATSTRVNTLKNTGPHTVKKFLAMQATEADITTSDSNVALPKPRSLKSSKKKASPSVTLGEDIIEEATLQAIVVKKSKSTKRKSVMWAEELVQYQEEEKDRDVLVEVKKPVKVGVGSVRSGGVSAISTASKIAIGMGISGPSATNLIPDLALATITSIPTPTASSGTSSNTKANIATATAIPSTASTIKKSNVVGAVGGKAGGASGVNANKTPQKPKPSRIAAATTTAKVAATPKSRSRIALGMSGNGTPAPRKLRPKP